MKFQNPNFNFFERTDERTDAQTHGRTSRNQYAPHFFKVGGITTLCCLKHRKASIHLIVIFSNSIAKQFAFEKFMRARGYQRLFQSPI